jgi:aspartate aminotransferase
VYSPQELAAIAAVLRMHPHVWIMTDEIYEHFVYGGAKHTSLLRQAADLAPRTLLVNGLSKAYAFTGWRIGYGAGPAALVKAIGLILTQSTTCASAVSQAAAVAALEGEQQCVEDGRKLFESRRNRMHALLSAIPGITCRKPEGAFYTFPNVSGLVGRRTADGKLLGSDVDVMMYLLEQAGVAAVDGSSYGAPGHLRLSFATSMDVIEAGCAAIGAAVAALAPGESAVAAA